MITPRFTVFASRQRLRLKIKSLNAESKLIRHEEKKIKNNWRASFLTSHRQQVVRTESRSAQIAYAYLRGRKFHETESHSNSIPGMKRIKKLIEKYGATGVEKGLADWFSPPSFIKATWP